jgi:hypothetical protein
MRPSSSALFASARSLYARSLVLQSLTASLTAGRLESSAYRAWASGWGTPASTSVFINTPLGSAPSRLEAGRNASFGGTSTALAPTFLPRRRPSAKAPR